MTEHRLLEKAYEAFNARDVEAALATMHADVEWPNGMEGGTVSGHSGVRDYWTRQWGVIDPHVEPLRFEADAAGRTVVDVQQVVRDRAGNLVKDEIVQHVYLIADGLIRSMEIRKPSRMRVDLKPVAKLSDDERAALKALTAAVYPPDVFAASPGRDLTWASPDYSVLVSNSEGELVSHVGIVVRAGSLNDTPVRIGGVGSVKTHPQAEGRGYASAGLRRAAAVLHHDHQVAFSLLVCQEHLLPFYGRLGWLTFSGRLVVEQPTGRTVFSINSPMVLAGQRPAPQDGVIDLNGLPW